MWLGLPPLVFIHTLISLVALVAGIVVVFDLVGARTRAAWVSTFLVTAVATSATGFILPADRFLPSHATGIIALIVLAVALAARYAFHYAGAWRWIYAAGVVISVYFVVFVTIVQAFLKVPALHALAPTQTEAPFAIAQLVALILFVWAAIIAARRFRAPSPRAL